MLDFLVMLMFLVGCVTTVVVLLGFAFWFFIWRGTNR